MPSKRGPRNQKEYNLGKCRALGCERGAAKLGLCHSHYEQHRRERSHARDGGLVKPLARRKQLELEPIEPRKTLAQQAEHQASQTIETMVERGTYFARACSVVRSCFAQRTKTKMSDWVLDRMRLPQGEGINGEGRVSFEFYPELPWLFDMLQNPDVRKVDLCYSSQAGKTIILFSCMAYYSGELNMTGIVAYPTLSLTKKVPKTRIIPMLESTGCGFDSKKDSTLQFKSGSYIQIALMSSPATMAEMPAKYAIEDERDENVKWEVDPSELIENRLTTAGSSHKHIRASTPKLLTEMGMWACYNRTKRYCMEWPCPHCGFYFTARFPEHFRWPDGVDRREIQLRRLAWIECPSCNGKINDSYHRDLVRSMRVKCLDPDLPISEIGIHKRRWETIWKNFSDVVSKYLEVCGDDSKLVDFYNSWCAEPRDLKIVGGFPKYDRLRGEWSRDQKEIPSWVQYVTAGADVGANEIWVHLTGWGESNRVCSIFSAHIVVESASETSAISALTKINAICDLTQYRFLGDGVYKRPEFLMGCIDSGFHTTEIYDLCRASVDLWRPVRGDNGTLKKLYEKRQADPEGKHGRAYRGVYFYYMATHMLQDIIQKRFWAEASAPGSIEFARDEGKRLFEHLNAAVREETEINGRTRVKWRKVKRDAADHLRDAMANAELAGRMCGLDSLGPQEKCVLEVQQQENNFDENDYNDRRRY